MPPRENRLQRGAAAQTLETFPRGKLRGLNSPLPWARVRRDGALYLWREEKKSRKKKKKVGTIYRVSF
jgi:hypothetical protein